MAKLHSEFNYYFETFELLAYCKNFEDSKQSLIQELDNLGMVGVKIYEAHFLIWEKVVLEFNNNKKVNENYDYFFKVIDTDENHFVTVLLLLIGDYYELVKKNQLTKKSLQNTLIKCIYEILEGENEAKDLTPLAFYNYLVPLELSEHEKWMFFSFYQSPLEELAKLGKLVDDNLALCKQIYEKYNITKLITNVASRLAEATNNDIPILKLCESRPIYPTFILPLSQVLLENTCYLGLFTFDIFSQSDFTKEVDDDTLMKLKLLSDRSKFTILTCLKERPMYSLELANKLNLSAGTVSHHMSILLQMELVTVDKNAGKVYYQLNVNTIKSLMARVNTLLI